MSPSFDPQRAFLHTENLCYPRRVGTLLERRAARYILRSFAALGLRQRRERFRVSHFPAEIGSRLVLVLCILLVTVGALSGSHPWMALLCWVPAAFLVNSPWRISRFLGGRWPPGASSANLLATLPEATKKAPARVIFMAHYDTKSQLLPTGVRVGLVYAATIMCGVLALLAAAETFGLIPPPAAPHSWIMPGIVIAVLLLLIANFTGNRSPGALDNGSAVGTLLELARSWRPSPEAPVEVVWVATGSEEVRLDGAQHFLRLHQHWWQEKPTLLINLESVGAGSQVYLAGLPESLHLAEDVADELSIPHGRLRVLGAGMDHEPFAARKLASVTILGDVVRHSLALHSPRDNMGLIDLQALDRAGQLAVHLAWRWAEMHHPKAAAAQCFEAEPATAS